MLESVMRTSRRVLVAGLVCLPAITAAADTVTRLDPIFAAIDRHRAAYAAAEQELLASHNDLFGTEPQTIRGCKALVDFLLDDAGAEDGLGLDLLSRALDRLA